MSLGLTHPPLADSTMLTLTSHYTATNAKHHRYAAAEPADRPGPGRLRALPGWVRPGDGCEGPAGCGAAARRGAVRRPGGSPCGGRASGGGPLDRLRHEWGGCCAEARVRRLLSEMQVIRETSGTTGRAAARGGRHAACDLGKDREGRDWVSGISTRPRGPRQARGQPGAQKSFRFRHPSPEPNTGGKRLTCDG
jgi:hypothetical protein